MRSDPALAQSRAEARARLKCALATRALAALALVMVPLALAAQSTAAADALLARGDTSGAIAAYEQLIKTNLQNTEAHYRLGQIHLVRVDQGADVSEDRRKAEEHFRYATRFAPDSAKYLLALAELLRRSSETTARMQVAGLVDQALTAARAHGSAELAAVAYRAAVISWERYERRAHSYMFVGDVATIDLAAFRDDWQYTDHFFEMVVKPDPSDPGSADRNTAEERLRLALSADPRHVDAAGLLIVLMGEEQRWPEAHEVARRLVAAAPNSGRALALLGQTLARMDRWREAQAAYDRALARMTADEKAPYLNLTLILRSAAQGEFARMTPAQRAQLDAAYWTVSQPLFLDNVNQPRVEFFARLTYVIHRWSDPLRGQRGFDTDRGVVYVRYGPPDVWATLGSSRVSTGTQLPSGQIGADAVGGLEADRVTITWLYKRSQLRFAFSLAPGFARTIFAGDFRSFYNEAQNLLPVRFDNVPAVWDLDTVLVQFAQFRGQDTAKTDLAVFSFMPIGRMARRSAPSELQLATAAIVKDGRMRDVHRLRNDEMIRGGDSLQVERRSWRLSLAPSDYLLRVEAMLPALERGARSSSALKIRPYGSDSLMLSDVIVAERVTPRDSAASRWTDFFIEPSAGRLKPKAPLGLLWEVYNLVPDSTGVARYRIDLKITVKEIERRGFAAKILGGIRDAVGLSARGDDQVALTFNRDVPAQRGSARADYLSIDLENAPEATYGIFLTITDLVSGRSVQGARQIVVTETALTR